MVSDIFETWVRESDRRMQRQERMCYSLWTTGQHTQRLLDWRPSSWNSHLLTPPVCYSLWIKVSLEVSSFITESLFFNAQFTSSTSGEKARGRHQCTASLALDWQGLAPGEGNNKCQLFPTQIQEWTNHAAQLRSAMRSSWVRLQCSTFYRKFILGILALLHLKMKILLQF